MVCLHYSCKNLYDKSIQIQNDIRNRVSLISSFSSSFPRYHSWFSSEFCDTRRSNSSVALSFDFASCVEFHQFYHSHHHDQTGHRPLSSSNFCDGRISRSSVTLSLLDCGSCILLCNSTRQF